MADDGGVSPFGVPMSVLSADAKALGVAAFAKKHAPAFFVRLGQNASTPRKPMRTLSRPHDPGATGETIMFVLYVKKRPVTEHPFISIGRLEGNDIAIADDSVSKFHAFVKEAPGGGYVLQDARSKNGTLVDGVRVAARGEGPATPLSPGQAVRFGTVHCSFVDAAGLVELLRKLG